MISTQKELNLIESKYPDFFQISLVDYSDDIPFLSALICFFQNLDCIFHAVGMKDEIEKIVKSLPFEDSRVIIPRHRPFLFVEMNAIVSRIGKKEDRIFPLKNWNGLISENRELLFFDILYRNEFQETEKQLLHGFIFPNHFNHIQLAILNEPDSSCTITYICLIKKRFLDQLNNFFQNNGVDFRLIP